METASTWWTLALCRSCWTCSTVTLRKETWLFNTLRWVPCGTSPYQVSNSRPTVDQQSSYILPTVRQQLAKNQPTVGQMSVNSYQTVDQGLTNSRPNVSQQSTINPSGLLQCFLWWWFSIKVVEPCLVFVACFSLTSGEQIQDAGSWSSRRGPKVSAFRNASSSVQTTGDVTNAHRHTRWTITLTFVEEKK